MIKFAIKMDFPAVIVILLRNYSCEYQAVIIFPRRIIGASRERSILPSDRSFVLRLTSPSFVHLGLSIGKRNVPSKLL
jgi:hypothetical protein